MMARSNDLSIMMYSESDAKKQPRVHSEATASLPGSKNKFSAGNPVLATKSFDLSGVPKCDE